MSLSTLAISFGDRRVFAVVWWAIAGVLTLWFIAELVGVLPVYVPHTNELLYHFVVLIGCYALVGVGGFSAQRSIDTNKRRVKASQKALAEQNELLEGLSSKLAEYLSPQVYQSIFEGRQEGKIGATRKKLTIYFADIVGFTEATQRLEPEDLSEVIKDYFENIAEIVLRHGGTIDKYMGDSVMVFFGDPDTLGVKEDAIACMNMALEIRARIQALEEKWAELGLTEIVRMRSGINTGYCTVGIFGSENRMDYTIIGAQVNVAARLEREAEPNQILISHQSAALVKNAFHLEQAGEYSVKGIQAPVQAYRLDGFKGHEPQPPARAASQS